MTNVLTLRVAARYLRAIEFPSEKARKEYLQEHPGADPAKHTVTKHEEGGPAAEERAKEPSEKAKGWLARATGEVKSFFTNSKARQELLGKASDKLKEGARAAGLKALQSVKGEIAEAKTAFAGIRSLTKGEPITPEQTTAIKKVALKAAATIAAGALVSALPAVLAHGVVGQQIANQVAKSVVKKAIGGLAGVKLAATVNEADIEGWFGELLASGVAEVLGRLPDGDLNEILEAVSAESV